MRYLLILLIAALPACTSVSDLKNDISERIFGREELYPPAELVDFKPTVQPKILWSAKVGESESHDFIPAADGEFIYAANKLGKLTKLNAATGKIEWQVDAGEHFSAGVGAGNGVVLAAATSGYVYCYDQTGKLRWKSRVSSEVLATPILHNEVAIVRAGDGRIFGLNLVDGSRKWIYERTLPALSLRSSAGVLLNDGLVYAGFAGGKLVAIQAEDGNSLWETSVAQPKGTTEIERIADITSLPFVDGPIVFAAAFQGKVAAVDRDSGRVGWGRDISSYTGIHGELGRLYVTQALGAVYSLEYATGKTYWRQADLNHRKLTSPLAMSEFIAVGDLEGYVHLLQREDGAFAARIKTDDSQVMPRMMELSPGVLVLQTRKGGVFAIALNP